jgi:hypothetical protein
MKKFEEAGGGAIRYLLIGRLAALDDVDQAAAHELP